MIEIIEKIEKNIAVFKPVGRLDSNTSPELEKKILDTIERGFTKIIIDFKSLDYISSAGLRVINKTTKQLKNNSGSLVLCSMQDYIKEVFEITGFDSFLPIVSTYEEALDRISFKSD